MSNKNLVIKKRRFIQLSSETHSNPCHTGTYVMDVRLWNIVTFNHHGDLRVYLTVSKRSAGHAFRSTYVITFFFVFRRKKLRFYSVASLSSNLRHIFRRNSRWKRGLRYGLQPLKLGKVSVKSKCTSIFFEIPCVFLCRYFRLTKYDANFSATVQYLQASTVHSTRRFLNHPVRDKVFLII